MYIFYKNINCKNMWKKNEKDQKILLMTNYCFHLKCE